MLLNRDEYFKRICYGIGFATEYTSCGQHQASSCDWLWLLLNVYFQFQAALFSGFVFGVKLAVNSAELSIEVNNVCHWSQRKKASISRDNHSTEDELTQFPLDIVSSRWGRNSKQKKKTNL